MNKSLKAAVLSVTILASPQMPAVESVSSLLWELDEAIDSFPVRIENKERHLQELRQSYNRSSTDTDRYIIARELYFENKSYMNDSALYYLDKMEKLAVKMHDKELENFTYIYKANQCIAIGHYIDAHYLLDYVAFSPETTRRLKAEYYHSLCYLFSEQKNHTSVGSLLSQYENGLEQYLDSLYNYKSADTYLYLKMNEVHAVKRGMYDTALALNNTRREPLSSPDVRLGDVYYMTYLINSGLGHPEEAEKWLIKSALNDITNVTMDQASVCELAKVLYKTGDVNRSFRYIHFASQCSSHFNSPLRNSYIASNLSNIDSETQSKLKETNVNLRITLCVIGLLFIILIIMQIYTFRQKKSLMTTREKLISANETLDALNTKLHKTVNELDEANKKQIELNSKYRLANQRLNEANRVNEEYLNRFMKLCSQYIDKMTDFRKKVERKYKSGELKSFLADIQSDESTNSDLDVLYSNFDMAFMSLYPSFVEEFNKLLKPEARFEIKEDERLPTELRIFALIKLNINDSATIARFLHYSPNTIYNYRAKVKNNAIGNRDDFENRVKDIGI